MDLLVHVWPLTVVLLVFALINFIISLVLKRNDIADVSWGLGFILVSGYLLLSSDSSKALIICSGLVILWALRISIYIAIRNSKKSEDFRYKQWREEWGSTFLWRSFLQIYVLQMLILLIISTPLILLALNQVSVNFNLLTWLFILIWTIGFLWQSVADYQLYTFKRKNKGKVMKYGLWKYSRHPNYFGEMVMWWSIFLLAWNFGAPIYAVVSPLLITYLLFNVSGVPMLEKKYQENEEYQAYVDSTPAIFPKLF
ncbi:MAG: DUF1295 domain-containing protein [Fulvivirga sp.]|uniref:DUF1295 domain-containing protein n=1 Tax=Fulvivirga sp. TaxID=1931237 RepID=UPI0032EF9F3F